MSLANLTDLESALADWLYRAGDATLAARAADFVSLFEADFLIDPENRAAEMEEVDTTPIAGAIIPLPTGFIDMIRLQIIGSPLGTPNQVLTYCSPSQAAILDATTSNTGIARWYTVIAGQIYIAPQKWAPVGATLEMAYHSFSPLSGSNTTNWLMTKYPNLYLYGSLMQASAFVDNPTAVLQWKAARDEAMAKFARSERKRKLGAAPLAVGNSVGFVR